MNKTPLFILIALLCVGRLAADVITWNVGGVADWDTATANWTGDDSFYSDGDDVTFGGNGYTVTVQTAGVAPGSMAFNNASGTITLRPGAGASSWIEGGGGLTKTGAGTVIFDGQGLAYGLNHGNSLISGGTVTWLNPGGSAGDTLWFGTGTITLENNAKFMFRHAVASPGLILGNDFVIGAGGGQIDLNRVTGNPVTLFTGAFELQGGILSVNGPVAGNAQKGADLQGAITLTADSEITMGANFANGVYGVISGNIGEDATPRQLTLRMTSGNHRLQVTGDNTGLTGGIVVGAGVGYVKFGNQNALGGGGAGNLTIQDGAYAGFDFVWDGNALAKIATTSTGILGLDGGNTAEDIDLATLGADIRIGASENAIYTGTLTPYDTTYKLGGGAASLILPNANVLTGARSLDIASSGAVPVGIVTLSNANDFTEGTLLRQGTLRVAAQGALGAGAVTMTNGVLQFITVDNAFANDLAMSGSGTNLNAGRIVTYSGNVTAANAFTLTGNGAHVFAPGAGKSFSANRIDAFSTLQATAVASLNGAGLHLFGGGVVVLQSGMTWADFDGAYSRVNGVVPGASQYRISGGGFAARGAAQTIDSGNWDTNFTLGASARNLDSTLYADAGVILDFGAGNDTINLSATVNRTITVRGGNQEAGTSGYSWTIQPVVNEVAGKVTGGAVGRTWTIKGQGTGGTTLGGNLQFSNPDNDFRADMTIGGADGGGVAAIFTSDGAFGHADNVVTVRDSGLGPDALLLLRDTTGSGTVFTRGFTISQGDASGQNSGWGSFSGMATYRGTVTYSGGLGPSVLQVREGSLRLGNDDGAATINNTRTGTGATMLSLHKGMTGELILDDVVYSGNVKWLLHEGTLTTHSPDVLHSAGGNSIALGDLLGNGAERPRTWHIAENDHLFTLASGGNFRPNMTLDVDAGLTLRMDMGTATLIASEVGPNTTGLNWGIVKTGGGAWVYHNTQLSHSSSGRFDAYIKVDQGTFDVTGNMGRNALWLSGGTLLPGTFSAFTGNRFHVDSDGGKIGVSENATGDVLRNVAFDGTNSKWDLGGVGALTLAARDNYSLAFGTSVVIPDIAAGETLRIERDGTGAGSVQFRGNSSITVSGTLGGSGALQIGNTGTGTLLMNGTLAPGSSPGTLTVIGNLSVDTSAYLWELGDTALDYDSVAVFGNLNFWGGTISLNLASAGSYIPNAADTFALFSVSGGTIGGFDADAWDIQPGTTGWTGGTVYQDGNTIYLTGLAPVPEPATLALLGLGGALAVWRRRRRLV